MKKGRRSWHAVIAFKKKAMETEVCLPSGKPTDFVIGIFRIVMTVFLLVVSFPPF